MIFLRVTRHPRILLARGSAWKENSAVKSDISVVMLCGGQGTRRATDIYFGGDFS